MGTVYAGLRDEHADLWPHDVAGELHEYGFTTGSNTLGLFAVREAGPYRTRIVPASCGWRVFNVHTPSGHVVYERRATLSDAVDYAIKVALSGDAFGTLQALLTRELNAELGRTS